MQREKSSPDYLLYPAEKNGIMIPTSPGAAGGKRNEVKNMTYKEEFITFMVRSGVLTFGDFTTKSEIGRAHV